MGVKFEQRYYVVGENKAYDIISGDSEVGTRMPVKLFCWPHLPVELLHPPRVVK